MAIGVSQSWKNKLFIPSLQTSCKKRIKTKKYVCYGRTITRIEDVISRDVRDYKCLFNRFSRNLKRLKKVNFLNQKERPSILILLWEFLKLYWIFMQINVNSIWFSTNGILLIRIIKFWVYLKKSLNKT